MKLYLHVGMSKAGSTSIQNTFTSNADLLLDDYQIYYPKMDTDFQNHFKLHSLLESRDTVGAQEYIGTCIEFAAERGAKAVFLSSEDLFLLPTVPGGMDCLQDAMAALDDIQLRVIAIIRHPRTWMKSYLGHLITNGAFAINENAGRYPALAGTIVDCIRAYSAIDPEIELLSFRRMSEQNTLVRDFFRLLEVPLGENWERKDNVTGAERFFSMESLIGNICGLRAFNCQVHPNEARIQQLRHQTFELVDSMSRNPSVARLMIPLEALLRHELNVLIDKSIAALTPSSREYLDSLDRDDGCPAFKELEP